MIVMQRGDCFTRRGSLLSIAPAAFSATGEVCSFSVGRMGTDFSPENRRGLDLFTFCFPETAAGVSAQCEPEAMRFLRGDLPVAELCFPSPDLIRFRCRGLLHFTGTLKEHEALIDRLDGTFQLGFFDSLGEMLFWPLRGQGRLQCAWDLTKAGTGQMDLLFLPDAEGTTEVCLRYGNANVEKVSHLPSYEVCVENVRTDYLRWCDCFAPASGALREKHHAAVWHLWNCMVQGQGRLTSEIPTAAIRAAVDVYGAVRCAAALLYHPSAAVRLVRSLLSYQSASGCLPSGLDDINADFVDGPSFPVDRGISLPPANGEDRQLFAWLAALGETLTAQVQQWAAEGGAAAYPAAPLRQNLRMSDSAYFLLAERLVNQVPFTATEGGKLSP